MGGFGRKTTSAVNLAVQTSVVTIAIVAYPTGIKRLGSGMLSNSLLKIRNNKLLAIVEWFPTTCIDLWTGPIRVK